MKLLVITLSSRTGGNPESISDKELDKLGKELSDTQLWQMTGNEARDTDTVISVKVIHQNGQIFNV